MLTTKRHSAEILLEILPRIPFGTDIFHKVISFSDFMLIVLSLLGMIPSSRPKIIRSIFILYFRSYM